MGGAPTGMYPCAPFGANDYIHVHVVTTRMWEDTCKAIGRPDLIDDPRFATGRLREEHSRELTEIVTEWCAGRTKHEAMTILAGAGVPAFAIEDTHDVFNDPHLSGRDFVLDLPHPKLGTVTLLGKPFGLEHDDVPIRVAPTLGQHTAEVLAAELDLSSDDLARLRDAGVINT
jgi:formyl-CoA transferase